MANFIGLVYATLKNEGIDTKGMDTDTAVAKYNELQKKSGGKEGADQPTPAENKRLKEKGIGAKNEGKEAPKKAKETNNADKEKTGKIKKFNAEEKRMEEVGITKRADWGNRELPKSGEERESLLKEARDNPRLLKRVQQKVDKYEKDNPNKDLAPEDAFDMIHSIENYNEDNPRNYYWQIDTALRDIVTEFILDAKDELK